MQKCGLQNFNQLFRIGQGAFATVTCVQSKQRPGSKYALKCLDKQMLTKSQMQHTPLIQKQILSKLRHPGIVACIQSFQSEDSLYLVLQYVQGTQLAQLIQQKKLNQQQKHCIARQLCQTITYLHNEGVVHRDLKPQNIIVTTEGFIKIIDFGSSLIIKTTKFRSDILKLIEQIKSKHSSIQKQDSRNRQSTLVGTANYISPQLLQQGSCSYNSDNWALGCILFQLFGDASPFQAQNQFLIFQKIKKAQFDMDILKGFPQLKQLVYGLLQKDTSKRLSTIGQYNIWDLPYLRKINRKSIFQQPLSNLQNLKLQRKSNSKSNYQRKIIKKGIMHKKMGFVICDDKKLEYHDPITGQYKGVIPISKQSSPKITSGCKWQLIGPKKTYYFKVQSFIRGSKLIISASMDIMHRVCNKMIIYRNAIIEHILIYVEDYDKLQCVQHLLTQIQLQQI